MTAARGVGGTDSAALIVGASWAGGDLSIAKHSEVYPWALWDHVLYKAERHAVVAAGGELVSGH